MKLSFRILKIVFLTLLLALNAVGFHYFFKTSANDNLQNVPADSKLVLTLNLKTVSLKLMNELLFHPDDFEKELITKREKKLVIENYSFGINPFGYITFFIFPFDGNMISGLSLNIEDRSKFIQELKNRDFETFTVDGVEVADGKKATYFVFEKAAILLFEKFEKSKAEELAVVNLQNEKSFEMDPSVDFQLTLTKGLFIGSPYEKYFQLLPEFAEQVVFSGIFEKNQIAWNGNVLCTPGKDWKETIQFRDVEVQNASRWDLIFEGRDFIQPIHDYMNQKFSSANDTSGKIESILSEKYTWISHDLDAIQLPGDLLQIGADFFSGKPIDVNYLVKLELGNDRVAKNTDETGMSGMYLNPYLKGKRDATQLIRFEEINMGNMPMNFGYFSFDFSQLLSLADINDFIKAAIEPYIIFEGFSFWATEYKEKKLFFEGKTTFKDKEVHPIIQFRKLFKDVAAVL